MSNSQELFRIILIAGCAKRALVSRFALLISKTLVLFLEKNIFYYKRIQFFLLTAASTIAKELVISHSIRNWLTGVMTLIQIVAFRIVSLAWMLTAVTPCYDFPPPELTRMVESSS
jgi:hypothetical protein